MDESKPPESRASRWAVLLLAASLIAFAVVLTLLLMGV